MIALALAHCRCAIALAALLAAGGSFGATMTKTGFNTAEKCDSLAGEARTSCVDTAEARFGKT